MFVNGGEFGIFEDQIIAELDRDDLVESVSLEYDESILVVGEDLGCDIGDIDLRRGIFKENLDVWCNDLSVCELEKYKMLSRRKYVLIERDVEFIF